MTVHAADCICQKDGNQGVLVRAMVPILAAHGGLLKALCRNITSVQRKLFNKDD